MLTRGLWRGVRRAGAPARLIRRQWLRILPRNVRARSVFAAVKNCAGAASSTTRPSSMNTIRSATFRANPISCVTTIIVMPSRARPTMTSSTSLIISGSRADVGSSNSIAIGSMARARAIATRCCCPPESWPGYLSLWAASPTRSRSLRPFCVASSRLRPSTFTCARVRLRITVMCGKSSKFWNTMPILERSFGRSVRGSPTETPSTVILPSWNGSKPFTHLMSVDLPLPEGPQTTTTSPFFTSVEQPVSTWKVPYHLLTFFIEIMRVAPDDGDAFLQALHQRRQAVGDDKIHDRHEGIHLDQAVVAVRDLRGGAKEIRGGDHVHERGVLEQDDRLREEHRQHVAEGLRQHDPSHRLPVVQSQRVARPDLAARDRLDAGAHDLAVVRRLEHGERDDARPERADPDRVGLAQD